jgi:hypothetical protein
MIACNRKAEAAAEDLQRADRRGGKTRRSKGCGADLRQGHRRGSATRSSDLYDDSGAETDESWMGDCDSVFKQLLSTVNPCKSKKTPIFGGNKIVYNQYCFQTIHSRTCI